MKNFIGKLLFISGLICFFSPQAQAQSVDSPMIYVQDLVLSTTTLIAGASVPGHATLVNKGNIDVPNVSYIASIVGDYKDGDPYTLFDSQTLGKVYVPAHSSKSVDFVYKIPSYLNGKGYGMEG